MGDQSNRYTRQNVFEYNTSQYDANNFQNAYSSKFNEQLSIAKEPTVVYEKVSNYLTISSKQRDIDSYPNPNHYAIPLNENFRNIHSIELLQAIIPAKNSVDAEPYLLLKIEELEDVMFSNDRNVSDAFAILQMAPPTTSGGFIQIDKRIHENTIKYFRSPKASLSKLTVTITDSDGAPFDFGDDDINPPAKGLQNTFVFRIVTMEKTRETLNQRNLY
jgi:hypothetical protein